MKKRQLVINEFRYVEDIIQSSTLPEDVSPNAAICYFTKYYYMIGYDLKQTIQSVTEKMSSYNFNVQSYQEYLAVDQIRKHYTKLQNGKMHLLRNNDSIALYESEYNKIMQCDTDREKKMLFTLYILARLTDCYGWVYQSEVELYKLANISHYTKTQYNVLSDLYHKHQIKIPKKIDDTKNGVNLSDGNENVVMEVTEINNLGNQFIVFIKDDYKLCENCGKLIKIKSNRIRYCKKCAIEKEADNAVIRKRKQRLKT